MNGQSTLATQEKQELRGEERTLPGRYYEPATDIYETPEALVVVMEMPGVDRQHIDVRLEENTLSVEGRVDLENYRGYRPVYTEYNVGHFARRFVISSRIDGQGISASFRDGVLTLTLPKVKEAIPRKVPIST